MHIDKGSSAALLMARRSASSAYVTPHSDCLFDTKDVGTTSQANVVGLLPYITFIAMIKNHRTSALRNGVLTSIVAVVALSSTPARADVDWFINLGIPGVVVPPPAPVYVAPPPVYLPPPPRVIYQPPPVQYGGYSSGYYYDAPPPDYYRRRYWQERREQEWREREHARREWRGDED